LGTARAEAEISIPYATKSDAEALKRALESETASSKASRASVRVKTQNKVVTMKFLASDLVALRAMLNSFLRLAATWRRISEDLRSRNEDERRKRCINVPKKR